MKLAWLSLLALGCRPYQRPADLPPLQVAQGPLRVVAVEGAEPRVHVVVRAGSAYDPPSREGLAFVVAHALAARAGADVAVGPEWLSISFPPGGAARVGEVLAAPIDEESMALARAAALASLRSRDCATLAQATGATWLWAGHPYGHAVAGRLSVLPTLSVAEAQAFRDARYVRDAVALALEGAVDASVLAPIEAAIPPRLSRSVTPAVMPPASRPLMVVEAPVDGTCIATRPAFDPPLGTAAADRAGQVLLDAVFGEPDLASSMGHVVTVSPLAAGERPASGVIVTADASPWRSLESSPTVYVLDSEELLR
ncbi:MAG: hypothetical protein FJ090_15535 [Deltaproteobacteria bacterium]|nr:hypothetical protein [Deltaproteobacteria bacterium]